ncbi:T-lymphocyte surface antigen Ly-9-like [Lampris incognitus]|uniref:T-lymphocyte surface antigen Ly-9-like n=1 Tax=Lampris incognitus TaxID=2546036 RepID=UPI0024B62B5C|nr:T-lymphocyte surface antigen Ly-9-like [Lampris incognitus]
MNLSVMMWIQLFCTSLLQVVAADQQVFGFLGASVTLPAGTAPSSNITKIIWFIRPNEIRIASFLGNKMTIYPIPQFVRRIALNKSSGDLAISNLTREDAMEYYVQVKTRGSPEHKQKVSLTVQEPLKDPSILTVFSEPREGGCFMAFECTSPNKGVNISWTVQASLNVVYGSRNEGHKSTLLIFSSSNNEFNCTCTTSQNSEKTSSCVTHRCKGAVKAAEALQTSHFGFGVLLGFCLGTLLLAICIFIGRYKKTCPESKSSSLSSR